MVAEDQLSNRAQQLNSVNFPPLNTSSANMPTTTLPTTTREILATANINAEFAAALKANSLPSFSGITIEQLKAYVESALPKDQAALVASRPADIDETSHIITLEDGHPLRIIIAKSTTPSPNGSPIIVLYHGGGMCVGSPEMEVPLARELVKAFSAICVLPCYRLAPEYTSPQALNDSWEMLQWIAAEASSGSSTILSNADLSLGFIIGGTSAGGNMVSVLAHLARDQKLTPPLTGQMNSIGGVIHADHVPEKYKPFYLSREQNKNGPVLNEEFYHMMRNSYNPDPESPLNFALDQHGERSEDGGVGPQHIGLPPAYFQCCGMDMSRDDQLIYERVLREECGIPTRIDLYPGLPHGWWSMMPELESSKKRMVDTVDGMGWMLGFNRKA